MAIYSVEWPILGQVKSKLNKPILSRLSGIMIWPLFAFSQQAVAGNQEDAVDISANYTAETWYNKGGESDGWRYLDSAELAADIDLKGAIGWHGARANASLHYTNGASLAELTGDAQMVSNIETGVKSFRLFEAWIEQTVSERTSLRLGLYDLNTEFDALESSSLFVGSAHGIGTDIGQTGENGPSIYPVTSLALRVQSRLSDNLILRAAVLDGVPGDPANPARTAVIINMSDGALLIAEGDWQLGKGRVLFGGWRYTQRQLPHIGNDTEISQGGYVRGESTLLEIGGKQLAGFARLGIASGSVNPFDLFASAGLTYSLEEDWQAGLAVAFARTSSRYRLAENTTKGEASIEATITKPVTDWLTVQPSIHYIINPGVRSDLSNALAIGLRLSFEI